MPPIADIETLLRDMEPVLNDGQYVFASLGPSEVVDPGTTIAFVREPEGLSVVLEESEAARQGVAVDGKFAWITLSVNSDLQAVGLTAAFSAALADAGISCNVVAGANHDHLFVPVCDAGRAMAVLQAIQRSAREGA